MDTALPRVAHAAPEAAYIHVPFCRHRCGYCNFTLVANRDDLIETYLEALDLELSRSVKIEMARGTTAPGSVPCTIKTLFVGGGTPTHLSSKQLERLFVILGKWLQLADDAEFSVEANPSDLNTEKVQRLADAGVTRLSLGVQSFQANKLHRLERDHDAATIEQAISLARRAGIGSISVDLIFGAPEETRASWQSDLRSALDLSPDHISTYGLTIERGTQFWNRLQRAELATATEEDERWMYETAIETVTAEGLEHYEVSSFARPGHRCRHNQVYWTGGEYFAAGPGAAKYVDGRREINHRSTTTYLKRVLAGDSPVAESEVVDAEQEARERLVFGLRRLIEGVDLEAIATSTGVDCHGLFQNTLDRYRQLGFLEQTASHVRLTRAGLLVSDSLWPDLL